ncbi:hypothetical protein HRI_003458100 [Hibiscus trionum]|uniref:RBR-type E3 ubiquitin transferase n=1 Tax=Hibiscus trionum TaxID=183268 RepID=A0A9W7IMC8_HIBTR|nr:hypothetical protein HRI_003458100 [Hibiscus trionum]
MGIFQNFNLKSKFTYFQISCNRKARKIGCSLGKFLNSAICKIHVEHTSSIDEEEEENDEVFTERQSMNLSVEIKDGNGYDCGICTETKPVYDSFDFKGCSHIYCLECIVNYIKSKIDDNVCLIKCPESNCEGVLDPEYCREILPRGLFNRWGKALCESAFLGSEKLYCPYQYCSALLINDGGRVIEKFKCPFCKRAFCVQCKVAWHSGMSCRRFQKLERLGPDALFADLAKRKSWRQCPHCSNYVAKSFGCNYIKCRCGKDFCYYCGSSLVTNGNHEPFLHNCQR